MKRKISITLEEKTILSILEAKRCTKSEFIEAAVSKFLDRLEAGDEA
jgi:hypothetical protein